MNDKDLQEIALKYITKGYNHEQLMYGDDLYSALEEDKDRCVEYWFECREIGIAAFKEKYQL